MRTIFFDMDGTIANLYAIENWLEMLRAFDETPYAEAKVMLNMSLLARLLNRAQAIGYKIEIISWLSKCPNDEYDEKVTNAKINWLNKHLTSVKWDKINIVAYGTPKSSYIHSKEDVLFDDEENNRNEWQGIAYEPNEIIRVLKELLILC